MELSNKDILQYAIDNGIIDMSVIQDKIQMNERKKYLKAHKNKVWESNGMFFTYLPDKHTKRGLKLIKRKTQQALEDSIVEYYKSVENEPYIEDIFNDWVMSKYNYGEIKKQTLDRYKDYFDKYIRKSNLNSVKFRYITEDILENYIKSTIHDNNMTTKCWSNLKVVINGIFKRAKKKGYTQISITSFIGDLEISRNAFKKVIVNPHDKVFTNPEEIRLINEIKSEPISLLGLGVIVGFRTGLRSGELSALTWEALHEDYIEIVKMEERYKDENGKYVHRVVDFPKTEAGVRKVIIPDDVKEIFAQIRKLSHGSEYIFYRDGKRIIGRYFTSKLYRLCRKLDINQRSLHKARMTYGTQLIDAKLPDSLIMSQMGHSSIETTRRYYYYNNKEDEEAKEAIKNAISL